MGPGHTGTKDDGYFQGVFPPIPHKHLSHQDCHRRVKGGLFLALCPFIFIFPLRTRNISLSKKKIGQHIKTELRLLKWSWWTLRSSYLCHDQESCFSAFRSFFVQLRCCELLHFQHYWTRWPISVLWMVLCPSIVLLARPVQEVETPLSTGLFKF